MLKRTEATEGSKDDKKETGEEFGHVLDFEARFYCVDRKYELPVCDDEPRGLMFQADVVVHTGKPSGCPFKSSSESCSGG
jgi:hypothetical protein